MRIDDAISKLDLRPLGRCLVIGGSGFLGRNLIRALKHGGAEVTAFCRNIPGEAAVPFVSGDIRELSDISAACAGADTVFHTASLCGMWSKRQEYEAINITGTANILQACRSQRCKRVIYTSTPSVVSGTQDIIDGDETLPYPPRYYSWYPATKRVAESAVLAANSSQLKTCALRPHLLWGPDDPHFIPEIRKQTGKHRVRQIGGGKNVVSITHIQNAVIAHIQAALELSGSARCAGRAYFICDEHPVLLWQWLNQLIEHCGGKPITGSVNKHIAYFCAAVSEFAAKLLPHRKQPFLNRFIVRQLTQSHSFSWQAANRDFGYTPIISTEEGLAAL